MNILFLTQVLPYPIDAGPKIRAYYNLRYLAKKHTITLVSFVRRSDKLSSISSLKSFCAAVETVPISRSGIKDGLAMAKSIIYKLPFLIIRDRVGKMDQKLHELICREHFDVIHADQLWMAPYALMARADALKNGYSPWTILDQHNAVFMIPKRMADSSQNILKIVWLRYEAKLMADYEKKTCQKFNKVVWVTQEDRNAVNSLMITPGNKMLKDHDKAEDLKENSVVIPICFDPDCTPYKKITPEMQDILFLGGMHWPPNKDGVLWFAKAILPLIHKSLPSARFIAVGKQPPDILKKLGENVIAPGYVPNTDKYFSSSRVFIVPLLAGGGMRVKILDAWARGIPVVSTTIGAEGITYNLGKDILIGNTPEEFARAILLIMTDNNIAQRLSYYGRENLENHYAWKKIYPKWDQVYKPA
jgi:polysaccharide biosynthesis protein PslH